MLSQALIFVILTAAILGLIGLIIFIEKVLTRKKIETIQTPEYALTQELSDIKRSKLSPQETLSKVDTLARKVLSSSLGNDGQMDYSQLAESYANKPHVAKFSADMAKCLYAGESLTPAGARGLIVNLEEMMQGEGKIIMVEQKHEQIEAERLFLDRWMSNAARGIAQKINDWKSKKQLSQESQQQMPQTKPSEETLQEIAQEEDKIKDIDPDKELKKITTKIVPQVKKAKKGKKEKEEYKYIESLDVLDRIKRKLDAKEAAKVESAGM